MKLLDKTTNLVGLLGVPAVIELIKKELEERRNVYVEDVGKKRMSAGEFIDRRDGLLLELLGFCNEILRQYNEAAKTINDNLEEELERFCLELESRKEKWFELSEQDKKLVVAPTYANLAGQIANHFAQWQTMQLIKNANDGKLVQILGHGNAIQYNGNMHQPRPDEPVKFIVLSVG